MPELPEVETLRRSLVGALVGRTVRGVTLRRRDVVTGGVTKADLLVGERVERLERRGKQLAIVAESGRTLCVHLGMSGSVVHVAARTRLERRDHAHAEWRLSDGSRVVFRDPRRFGGLWTFGSFDGLLSERWSGLGPDALVVTPAELRGRLSRTARGLKAALLDQSVVAGLGNIYVDESLFRARLSPERRADTLGDARPLVRAIRTTLGRAIEAGGSTLSAGGYRNGRGEAGSYQAGRLVYGRAGSPCPACRAPLHGAALGQRSTVWCLSCQR